MKKHTVKRTWTRADGTVVSRTYSYDKGKSRRGRVLVNAKGKVNYKNVKEYKDKIQASDSLNEAEKRTLIADLEARIKERKRNKKKLTTTGFAGAQHDAEDRISRLFANAGYSVSEAAEEYDLDESKLLDTRNWSGDTYTEDGVSYEFKFTYTGALFKKI